VYIGKGSKMKLYHVTTEKKAKAYRRTGHIKKPVRGFTTLMAAMAWAVKTHRPIIYQFKATIPYKLPDHHNEFGEAWWNDEDVSDYRCVFSADKDA